MLLVAQSKIPDTRFHGLDAARGIALLIGIFHHGVESMVSYVNSDWITQDSKTSLVIDVLFYVSHVFRMQAFFLMSGFFAHVLFHRKGTWGFVANRTKRLLLPFLLFWPALYAVTWHAWVWGIQYVRHIPYDLAVTKLPDYMVWACGFPFMHLWFLYFLILFCAGVLVVHPIFTRWFDPMQNVRFFLDRILFRLMDHKWGGLTLGFLMIWPMMGMTDWFGVDTSSSGLLPKLWPFTIYGFYFALGWFIHRQPSLLDSFRRFRLVNLFLSVIIIASVIILSLLFSDSSDQTTARWAQIGINIVYAFASITAVFAFIGYMLFWFSVPNVRVRYLSDSAYWCYLMHLPIIALLQILVAPLDWHWSIKMLAIIGPTCCVLFFSYHYLVRNSWIGKLLNGPRENGKELRSMSNNSGVAD